jgi:hypothetical protein
LLPVNASWAQKPEEQQEVRIVVKTDGGDDLTVVEPGDANATANFVFRDFSDATNDAVVVSELPGPNDHQSVVFDTQAFVFADGAATAGSSDDTTHVTLTLKNDDSTISVSADSVDEAIKKIQEQIKVLKSKASPGENDKAQRESLERAAKELEQIAKGAKGAVFKLGGSDNPKEFFTARNVMIRKTDDVKTAKTPSAEKKAEIEKMRSRVKELSKELADSQRKLAELEGSNVAFRVVKVPAVTAKPMRVTIAKQAEGVDAKAATAAKIEEKDVKVMVVKPKAGAEADSKTINSYVTRVQPKVVTGRLTAEGVKSIKSDSDRIDALEKKLDKVINAIESLRKPKGD